MISPSTWKWPVKPRGVLSSMQVAGGGGSGWVGRSCPEGAANGALQEGVAGLLSVPTGSGDTLLGWTVISLKGGHHGLAQWPGTSRSAYGGPGNFLSKRESQDPPLGAQESAECKHPRRFWMEGLRTLGGLCHCRTDHHSPSSGKFAQTTFIALPSFTPQFRKWRDYRPLCPFGVI